MKTIFVIGSKKHTLKYTRKRLNSKFLKFPRKNLQELLKLIYKFFLNQIENEKFKKKQC